MVRMKGHEKERVRKRERGEGVHEYVHAYELLSAYTP